MPGTLGPAGKEENHFTTRNIRISGKARWLGRMLATMKSVTDRGLQSARIAITDKKQT